MRNSIYIVLAISLLCFACSNKTNKYKGYVFYNNKPLINVTVIEDGVTENFTKTNEDGYFILERASKKVTRDLVFKKEGYFTDTLRILRGKTGGKIYFLFLREQSDTLFMKRKE